MMGKSRAQKKQDPLLVKLFPQEKQSGKKSGPSRSTLWRQQLSAEKKEELKRKDRDRKKKQYYVDQADESREGRYKKKIAREKNTERKRLSRARRKGSKKTTESDKDPKKKTSRKEYMRNYMRERRLNMSRQKKQAIKVSDKKRKGGQHQAGPSATSTPKKRKRGQHQAGPSATSTPSVSGAGTSGGYTTRQGKRKSVKRLKSLISQSPTKFVQVIESLMDEATPRKKRLLEGKGITASKEKRRKRHLVERFGEETQKLTRTCKEDRHGTAPKVVKTAVSRCINNIILKKYSHRCSWNYASKHFGLHWRYRKNTSSPTKKPTLPTRKVRKDKVSKQVESKVAAFYRSAEISQIRPDKKLGKKGLPTYIMQITFRQAFERWATENPGTKIGFTKFFNLKPKNVKAVSHSTRVACLCVYCVNIREKLDTINKKINTIIPKLQNEDEVTSLKASKLNDVNEFFDMLLCEKSSATRFHKPECIKGTCNECKDLKKTIGEFYHNFLQVVGTEELSWMKWELKKINITKKTADGKITEKEVTRRVLSPKHGSAKELIDDLGVDADKPTTGKTFVEHLFAANWQNHQVERVLKEAVKKEVVPGLVMLIQDFGRNFSAHYQDEIKSAHWVKKEVTIHPIVTYYIDPLSNRYTRDALIFLSDDLTHDHHAVAKFLDLATKHLKEIRGIDMKMQIQVNDGCGNQYKKATAFVDVSFGQEDYNCKVERNFYGSEHGKGEADGETSVVKGQCEKAILTRKAVIDSGASMFEFCSKNLTLENEDKGTHISRRSFFLVPKADIIHERPDRSAGVKTVKDTRKIHSVRSVSPFHIKKRDYSCFCTHCLRDDGEECANVSYTGPWELVSLKPMATRMQKKTRKTEAPVDVCTKTKQRAMRAPGKPTQQNREQDPPSTSASASNLIIQRYNYNPKVEDFVAVRLWSAKRKKNCMYIGKVQEVDASGDFLVKYVVATHQSPNVFTWATETPGWQTVDDIIGQMSQPILLPGRGIRMQFNSEELAHCTDKV